MHQDLNLACFAPACLPQHKWLRLRRSALFSGICEQPDDTASELAEASSPKWPRASRWARTRATSSQSGSCLLVLAGARA